MNREIVIAKADPYDAGRIAKLLEDWFTVSSIQWPVSHPGSMVAWALNVINNGYVVTAQISGRLLGVAGIQPCYLPWNVEQPLMRDAFFYVPEKGRRHGVANALIDACKLYCAKRGMPLIMEIISGVDTDKLEAWYGIKGGKYAGGVMVFGLPVKEE